MRIHIKMVDLIDGKLYELLILFSLINFDILGDYNPIINNFILT